MVQQQQWQRWHFSFNFIIVGVTPTGVQRTRATSDWGSSGQGAGVPLPLLAFTWSLSPCICVVVSDHSLLRLCSFPLGASSVLRPCAHHPSSGREVCHSRFTGQGWSCRAILHSSPTAGNSWVRMSLGSREGRGCMARCRLAGSWARWSGESTCVSVVWLVALGSLWEGSTLQGCGGRRPLRPWLGSGAEQCLIVAGEDSGPWDSG